LGEVLTLFREHELNREWFERNREKLIEKYDGKFIAIHRQAVVGFDEDVGNLMEKVEKKHPADKVSVEYVSKEKLQLIL